MDILIIGEFSGFAKHLKNGFEKLGHRVVITLNGDGWKSFKATGEDIFYKNTTWKIFGYSIRGSGRVDAFFENKKIQSELNRRFPDGIDLIVCINYLFLSSNPGQCGVSLDYVRKCISHGTKLIMSECGGSMAGHYSHKEYYEKIGYESIPLEDKRYSFLLEYADVVIPTIYSYYSDLISYSDFHPYDISKVVHAIPLPITVDADVKISSCINRRIVIFHGIINPEKKGTCYIQEAMDKIQLEYPDKVECICKGGMPYEDYLKLFERVDVLIDQCVLEDAWGVNATIGAMKGKCVLVSCGNKNKEHMNIPDIPFVAIKADTDYIYKKLKELVTHPEKIDEIKKASRSFVKKYCESSVVAQRYLDLISCKKVN